jgi:aminocarboxymuconate-semialdehyde decarboxylase
MTGQHLRNLVGNPLETALATARLLFSGILQDHPELKVVLAHGGGAAPWLIGRLAHGYRVRPEFVDGAADPADGVRRLYYDTVVFDPTVLRQLGELVGFDRLVLGSDYPFDMAEDDPVGFVRSSGLGEERVAAILRGAEHLVKQ